MALTLYYIAYLASATDPADDATGHAQIRNGQDGSGATAAYAGSTAWSPPSVQISPTGLTPGTLYARAAVVYDDVLLTYSNRVLATETKTAFGATGALASSAASVAGSADRSHVFAATGALAAAAGSVSGAATHITVHAATGALASDAGTVSGAAEHTAAGSFDASGALASQDGAIAGTAAHMTLHTSTGALSAQSATASGTAAHLTLHEATGALTSEAATVAGTSVHSGEGATQARATGAGRSSRQKQRRVVNIDGEDRIVQSDEEAIALLEDARDRAQKQADLAIERASKATRRPVRKVLADARKTLEMPAIEAGPGLARDVARILGDIRSIYQSAMNSVEIAARLASIQAAEEDDEEILMLIA